MKRKETTNRTVVKKKGRIIGVQENTLIVAILEEDKEETIQVKRMEGGEEGEKLGTERWVRKGVMSDKWELEEEAEKRLQYWQNFFPGFFRGNPQNKKSTMTKKGEEGEGEMKEEGTTDGSRTAGPIAVQEEEEGEGKSREEEARRSRERLGKWKEIVENEERSCGRETEDVEMEEARITHEEENIARTGEELHERRMLIQTRVREIVNKRLELPTMKSRLEELDREYATQGRIPNMDTNEYDDNEGGEGEEDE